MIMAGYFTQRRDLSQDKYVIQVYDLDGVVLRYRRGHQGMQSTYSYRSGPSTDILGEDTLAQDARIYERPALASSKYDTGHEFNTYKQVLLNTSEFTRLRAINPRNGYACSLSGALGPLGTPADIPVTPASQVRLFGGQAIGRTAPNQSSANLTNFAGELYRDGIPALLGRQLHSRPSLSSVGGEYLNWEFGWKPLISDLTKILVAVQESSRILTQYQRDSGRVVRRRATLVDEQSTTEETQSFGSGILFDGGVLPTNASAPFQITDKISRQVWFKGAYSYYLDVGESLLNKMQGFEQKANHLLGTRLTPDVLWELTPWSWLADWWGTFGQSLSNASLLQSDSLVLRYGYLMVHQKTIRRYSGNYTYYGAKPVHLYTTYLSERKERFKASPFGFGLLDTDLSVRQWAILGALGMTRAPGRAR